MTADYKADVDPRSTALGNHLIMHREMIQEQIGWILSDDHEVESICVCRRFGDVPGIIPIDSCPTSNKPEPTFLGHPVRYATSYDGTPVVLDANQGRWSYGR